MEFNLNDAKLTCEYINPVGQDFYRHNCGYYTKCIIGGGFFGFEANKTKMDPYRNAGKRASLSSVCWRWENMPVGDGDQFVVKKESIGSDKPIAAYNGSVGKNRTSNQTCVDAMSRIGFKPIYTNTVYGNSTSDYNKATGQTSQYTPQNGDVCSQAPSTEDGTITGTWSTGGNGYHICIFFDGSWWSDCKQSSMLGYNNRWETYTIWRFNGSVIGGQNGSTSTSSGGSGLYLGDMTDWSNRVYIRNMLLDEDLGGNKVYDLSKRSFNVKVMTINQIRKQQFLALSEEMINNSKGMGREIIKSGEPYEVQILKGDQTAKRRR